MVKLRECLYCFDIGEGFIYIYGVQQGLVVIGLVFVGDDEKVVRVFFYFVGDLIIREVVEGGFCDFLFFVVIFFRKGDDCLVGVFLFLQVVFEGVEVLDSLFNIVGDDYCLSLFINFVVVDYLGVEVVYYDFGFFLDGMLVGFYIVVQFFLGFFSIEEGVIFYCFGQVVIVFYGGVIFQYIEDKVFLDSLFYGVVMEGVMFDSVIGLGGGLIEYFQGFIFRSGSEGEVVGVGNYFLFF